MSQFFDKSVAKTPRLIYIFRFLKHSPENGKLFIMFLTSMTGLVFEFLSGICASSKLFVVWFILSAVSLIIGASSLWKLFKLGWTHHRECCDRLDKD